MPANITLLDIFKGNQGIPLSFDLCDVPPLFGIGVPTYNVPKFSTYATSTVVPVVAAKNTKLGLYSIQCFPSWTFKGPNTQYDFFSIICFYMDGPVKNVIFQFGPLLDSSGSLFIGDNQYTLQMNYNPSSFGAN